MRVSNDLSLPPRHLYEFYQHLQTECTLLLTDFDNYLNAVHLEFNLTH
jgi:hypothetical protein